MHVENNLNIYKISNINVLLGHQKVLHNISFDLKKKSITAILGVNGSGKSSLLNYLADSNSKGTKYGLDHLAYVAQKDYLDPYDTVSGQFKFQAQLDGMKLSKIFYQASTVHQVLHIDHMWSKRINTLSGGQKRAVALGLAFIKKPEVILLDEPTSSLDIDIKNNFWLAALDYKNTYNTTLLFATHHLWEVERFADYILVIDAGRLVYAASKNEFLNLVDGMVITLDIPKIHTLQDRIRQHIDEQLSQLQWLGTYESHIKYINHHSYHLDDVFSVLQAIIQKETEMHIRITVNSASIDDCFYYVLGRKEQTFQ